MDHAPNAVAYTLDRNANGTVTAWWTDRTDHLCHRIFVGYTTREIREIMAWTAV